MKQASASLNPEPQTKGRENRPIGDPEREVVDRSPFPFHRRDGQQIAVDEERRRSAVRLAQLEGVENSFDGAGRHDERGAGGERMVVSRASSDAGATLARIKVWKLSSAQAKRGGAETLSLIAEGEKLSRDRDYRLVIISP